MTFAVLRSLYAVIGDALDDIERVYAAHVQDSPVVESFSTQSHRPPGECLQPPTENGGTEPIIGPRKTCLSKSMSYAYVSPPPSPSMPSHVFSSSNGSSSASPLDFPSLDAYCDPTSLSEMLTADPTVIGAINRIVAAAAQMSATVQTPFLTLCDASMGYHLPSCLRLLEASHCVELLREAGPDGLHVNDISKVNGVEPSKLAHVLRLLATHHIGREISPNVFALNRISSLIDSHKSVQELTEWKDSGRPEYKYQDTNGVAAFVGLCTDEIQKSSAYLTESYYLSPSQEIRDGYEPTRTPFCYAFGLIESQTGFFGWLEGESGSEGICRRGHNHIETGPGAIYPPALGLRSTVKDNGMFDFCDRDLAAIMDKPSKHISGNPNRFRLERFGKAMSGTGSWEIPGAVLCGFDWRSLPKGSIIVDVGGGIGSTSMMLASAFSSTEDGMNFKFVIQDRPVVVEMGEKAWKARCPEFLDSGTALFQVHDFFTPQPIRNAAIFLLRAVLHDWPDEFARRILLRLREAATLDTKLLIADFILPLACADDMTGFEDIEGAECTLAPAPLLPNLGKASANVYWMDLTMQVMFNAKERTLGEVVSLTRSAGWKVVKVTKAVGSLFGHITAVPVPIPPQKKSISRNRTARFETAGAGHATTRQSLTDISDADCIKQVQNDQLNRNEIEMIERASSRCGTPTFGSRMELSSVEEAFSRFGVGSKSKGNDMKIKCPSTRYSSLKSPVVLNSAVRRKKPSPLSVPPLSIPSLSTVLPLPSKLPSSPRQPQPSTLRRRMSFAQLSSQAFTPMSLSDNQQSPPSPMSPRHPHLSLSRRASHTHLSQSPVPSMIPVRQTQDSPTTSSIRSLLVSPTTSRQPPALSRRPSYAQLSTVPATRRKHSGSITGHFVTSTPGTIGASIRSGSLHADGTGGAGKILRFDEEAKSTASPPRIAPGGGRMMLAAAARIEKNVNSRTFSESSP